MSYICTNSLAHFPADAMRHAVMCNEDGLVATPGILQRNEAGQYRFFAADPWPIIMAAKGGFDVNRSSGCRGFPAVQRTR